MEEALLWGVVIAAVLILFPLVAVDIYQRRERRIHKARGQRRTDKIRL